MKLALFDLDHCLLPIDSDYEWGEFTVTLGWSDAEEFKRRNLTFYQQYQEGTLNIHEYVRFATRAIREQGIEKSTAARDQFMRAVVQPAIKQVALDLVHQHQAAGDEVVVITATNEFVTRPIADAFGVQELIAVQLEHDAQGNITGNIEGTPSARSGKVIRVRQWLKARNLSWKDVHSVFYSDSFNDLDLLEQVNEPIVTNPDPKLRAIATERGWRILDLFKES